MFKFVTLILAIFFLSACQDDSVVHTGGEIAPGIIVDAMIDRAPKPFRRGKVKVHGYLMIGNISDEPQTYSNKHLWLNIDTHTADRTYVDSVASHIVDVGEVEIAPGQSIDFYAYWVLSDTVEKIRSDAEVSLYLGKH